MARNNKILLMKSTSTGTPAPGSGSLESGELALNYSASVKRLYFKDSGGTVREFIDSVQVQTKADAAQSAAEGNATALAIALG
jgi:hypothetical protein